MYIESLRKVVDKFYMRDLMCSLKQLIAAVVAVAVILSPCKLQYFDETIYNKAQLTVTFCCVES